MEAIPFARSSGFWRPLVLVVSGVLLAFGGVFLMRDRDAHREPTTVLVQDIVASEDLLLQLTPILRRLAGSVLNNQLPDHGSVGLFAPQVACVDVGTPHGDPEPIDSIGVSTRDYGVGTESVGSGEDLNLWRALLSDVRYFQNAKFYFVRGTLDKGRTQFDSHVGFSGLARMSSGGWRAVHVEQDVLWREHPKVADDDVGWAIHRWTTTHADTMESGQHLFRDVLREAVPNDETLLRARSSLHETKLVQLYRDGKTGLRKQKYSRFFTPDAIGQHPAVSVVDIDGDGHDDIYAMDRWSKNMLLRANGDGTFDDAAERFGLDIPGLCTGASFADFDNDGDVDLMLARSLEQSQYLRNEDGRFVNRSDLVSVALPYLAATVSAGDYDEDGLIDVYFGTYALPRRELRDVDEAAEFMPRAEAEELFERGAAAQLDNPFVNMVGPPNMLLSNRGDGRFARSEHDAEFDHWYNTFQATWSDFDDDGDLDLYLANDYAPDRLYRNRDGAGFEEVSGQFGGDAMLGFGMGASFGDYDNDGRQDLYVSNMFSKAGSRIAGGIPGIDGRLLAAAAGNLLFRNVGETFELVSGQKPPKLTVAKAGWSWGGMFGDFDLDGFLDIYVSSGYYTAPAEIAAEVDL